MNTFVLIFTPVMTLFLCMAIGYTLEKTKLIKSEGANTLAKLQTWVFCPALAFVSMAESFNVKSIIEYSTNITFSVIALSVALLLGIGISVFFVKEKCYLRGIYQYALVFANLGYMADPLVQDLFGTAVLGAYKFFCLPFTIVIYIWGISVLTPIGKDSGAAWKRVINFPTIALVSGMIFGITGLKEFIPDFAMGTLNSLKVCMGPTAMIIAGLTIAKYDIKRLVTDKKVYAASIFRLIILPTLIVGAVIGVRALANNIFGLEISAAPIYFTFFATAMPLGMNTVVFPEAYGGDPEPGASMAIISTTISILTVPLMYALLNLVVPCPFIT